MSKKLPQSDPISAYQRKSTAARRVGENAQCTYCDETQPDALITNSKPLTCAKCQRKRQGKTTVDDHHVAMRANHPANDARSGQRSPGSTQRRPIRMA